LVSLDVKALATLVLAIALHTAAAEKPQQYWDTPQQRFFGLGGNTVRTEVIKNGRDYTTDIECGRDLSQYMDGGSIELPRDRQPDFSKIRRFIWNCWQHKECGYIRYTTCFGACGTSHIFIEPGADGKWHIAWRIAGSNVLADLPDIVTVVWEKRQKTDLPDGKRVLVFKHPDGYEIQRM
jgi:hypothetical protein